MASAEEAWVVASSYGWNRGTYLFTLWRHGLSVNGGCQPLPPHLALLTAGCSYWWPPGIGPPCTSQEGSGDLQEGHPSVTKGASPSAKHPLKVPFTKTWRGLHLRKASRGLHLGKGGLEEGLKGARRGLQGGLKKASRGLQEGLKGAWSLPKVKGASRGLKGAIKASRGLKGASSLLKVKGASRGLKEAWRGLQGGLKGASRGLHLRKASRRLEGGFKGASKGFEGAWSLPKVKEASKGFERGLKGAWRGLQGGLKGFTFGRTASVYNLHMPN